MLSLLCFGEVSEMFEVVKDCSDVIVVLRRYQSRERCRNPLGPMLQMLPEILVEVCELELRDEVSKAAMEF